MLEIQNTITEMKNAFDGLISRLDMAQERISKLENISGETTKTKKQRKKTLREKNRTEYPKTVEQL